MGTAWIIQHVDAEDDRWPALGGLGVEKAVSFSEVTVGAGLLSQSRCYNKGAATLTTFSLCLF